MPSAITHISTLTPSGSAVALGFASIPATYDDLLLIGTLKGASTSHWSPFDSGNNFYFGHSSGTYWNAASNYNYQMLYDRYAGSAFLGYQNNNASAGTSDKIRMVGMPGSMNDANNVGGFWLYIPGYRNTTNSVGKGWQLFMGCNSNSTNAEQVVQLSAGVLPNTGTNNAIDTIDFYSGVGAFTTSSKIAMYGIKNS